MPHIEDRGLHLYQEFLRPSQLPFEEMRQKTSMYIRKTNKCHCSYPPLVEQWPTSDSWDKPQGIPSTLGLNEDCIHVYCLDAFS